MPEKILRLGMKQIQQCVIYKRQKTKRIQKGFQKRDSKRYNQANMNQKKVGVVTLMTRYI